jgi:DNA polymerase I-like protein with 3'-5' exonuclease and polymerase domains/5'-3' exonuclease
MDRLLIDASSILRAAHAAGKDLEFGRTVQFEGKPVWVNSAGWAYDSFMKSLRLVLEKTGLAPHQVILVLDGKNSRSLRAAIFPAYKGNRPPRAPEMNEAFNEALEGVKDEITALGGVVCYQEGMEADDVLAHLALNLKGKKVIWCRDKDMLALVSEDIHVLYGEELDPWIHSVCPPESVCVYKALCGDSSDNFGGAAGFGPKKFEDFVLQYGLEGLTLMRELIEQRRLKELAEDLPDFKPLQKILDSERDVYLAFALARLYPDRIDALQIEMQIGQGTHEEMRKWWQTKKLATPADAGWIVREIEKSPFVSLDIETDTPPESKEWAQKIIDASNGRRKTFVDIMGSYLCGMSLTFGENLQHTIYMSVRHAGENPWTVEDVMGIVGAIPESTPVVIHNVAFELPILFNEFGAWVENAVDTSLMCSWVDENESMGLKQNTKRYFNHEQMSYDQVTTKSGPVGTLPEGGKLLRTYEKDTTEGLSAQEFIEPWEDRQYGMSELTAEEIFDYGAADATCTAALYNRLRLAMELEDTIEAFHDIEVDTSYVLAEAFVNGIVFDRETLEELSAEDQAHFEAQWPTVLNYLMDKQWDGTVYVPFERTVAGIKAAFKLITGRDLDTRVRTESKLIAEVSEQGCPELAEALDTGADVDDLLQQYWEPNPDFDVKKSAHLVKLMYEVMGLPIRFRTVPTDNMRAKGIFEGNPQADFAAVEHALKLDLSEESEEHKVLLAIREMKSCLTREGLFYSAWPLYQHWKTGRVHMNFGQSRAATRRMTPNSPNGSQLSKKGDGRKVRKIIACPPGHVVCTMDFAGQELKLAAWASQDAAFLSCYLGEDLRDLHSMTGSAIAKRAGGSKLADYFEFVLAIEAGLAEAKAFRGKGKAVNFATQFLVRAKKLAKMLIVTEGEAQLFIDAKNETYPGLVEWQQQVISELHKTGISKTPHGAIRHLKDKLASGDKWLIAEAERQAINFKIQSAAKEQTQLAMNEMRRRNVFEEFRIKFVTAIHDECVTYIPVENIVQGIQAVHACMVTPYADMAIPAESDISIGWNFGELVGIGKNPTEENILAAYNKLKEAA